MNKLIVPWEKSVVLGCLFLLVTVMAVGAYVGIKEEGRAFNPVYQEQKTAGPMVNRAVGAAMEKYLDSADSSVSRVRIYSTTVNGDGAVTAIVYVSRLGCGGMQDDDSNGLVWSLGDTFAAIMVFINLIGIVPLGGIAVKLLANYERQKAKGLDPIFHRDMLPEVKNVEVWDGSDAVCRRHGEIVREV